MENKEKSPIEMLLDENNDENIVLFDEKNNETEFEQVAIIPVEEKVYAILKPVAPMEGLDDDQALVFGIEEIDDEDCLVLEDDEEVIDVVFDAYYALLREQGIQVDVE